MTWGSVGYAETCVQRTCQACRDGEELSRSYASSPQSRWPPSSPSGSMNSVRGTGWGQGANTDVLTYPPRRVRGRRAPQLLRWHGAIQTSLRVGVPFRPETPSGLKGGGMEGADADEADEGTSRALIPRCSASSRHSRTAPDVHPTKLSMPNPGSTTRRHSTRITRTRGRPNCRTARPAQLPGPGKANPTISEQLGRGRIGLSTFDRLDDGVCDRERPGIDVVGIQHYHVFRYRRYDRSLRHYQERGGQEPSHPLKQGGRGSGRSRLHEYYYRGKPFHVHGTRHRRNIRRSIGAGRPRRGISMGSSWGSPCLVDSAKAERPGDQLQNPNRTVERSVVERPFACLAVAHSVEANASE